MSKTNSKLASVIGNKLPKDNLLSANNIPKPDTINKSGEEAYKQGKWLKLLTMLNTLKLQPQYYRTETQTLQELQALIKECALENAYLTCQCIVYSRCLGEGMRTISHAASVFIAPHISGLDYAKRFYSLWDKQNKKGGVIYRPDDMREIIGGFVALNGTHTSTSTVNHNTGEVTTTVNISGTKLTNAMKKGFREALEDLDSYSLLKYKSKIIDVINLVHPNPKNSTAIVEYNGEEVYTLDAIIRGYNVSANTWEVNQGNAGQIVAQAKKEGKLNDEEAEQILKQAKADNWKELLSEGKLGILAALRNLRNIVSTNTDQETIDLVCDLVSNPRLIREGKIMPYQLDLANDIMLSEFSNSKSRQISQALAKGYSAAVPNLKEMLPGNNCIFLDQSGSMSWGSGIKLPNGKTNGTLPSKKAALIAATIAIATNSDVIAFGNTAKYIQYNPNLDVFTLAKQLCQTNMGGTSLASAWRLAELSGNKYDRVFILSDNECNQGSTYNSYMNYVKNTGHPYVYSVDLAGYGTNCIAGDKVRYYYGYGYSMFEDIASSEFRPEYHLEKVKQIEL